MKKNHFPVIENKKGKFQSVWVRAETFEDAVRLVFKSLVRGDRFVSIRHPETLEVVRYF